MENKPAIYIARHGITTWNKEERIQGQSNNIPLSEEGVRQMEILGSHLSNLNTQFMAIISPMKRALESFEIINRYLLIPEQEIFVIGDMKEMNFGEFEGLQKKDIASHCFFEKRKNNKWSKKYPRGESYEDVFQRLKNSNIIDIYLQAQKFNKSLLAIGHESINRIIPLVLNPEIETNNIAVNNRQENDEIVVLQEGKREKYNYITKKHESNND